MDKERKIVDKLNKEGQCVVRHDWEEEPDFWFVFAVWKMSGERNLYLDFDAEIGKYIFYFKSAEKQVKWTKNRAYFHYDVKAWVKDEVGHLITYAKRIIKTVSAKGIYLLKDKERIIEIEDDYETLTGLINWYSDGRYNEETAGMVSYGDKPYFAVGDYDLVLKKLKRMGYKTVQTYAYTGEESSEMLLDGDFGYMTFDWETEKENIEDYIVDKLQQVFVDCKFSSDYNDELRTWNYGLDLSDEQAKKSKRVHQAMERRETIQHQVQASRIARRPFSAIQERLQVQYVIDQLGQHLYHCLYY